MSRRPNFSLLWLSLALAGPFLPLLILPGGRVIGNPNCDNPSQFYYYHEFAGRCWRDGIVPLWNPHTMMGFPFLADGIASVFHPLSFLFVFLPAGIALNWMVAICFVLTGLFFYGWLRELQLGRAAAFAGAAVWCASNVLIGRIYAGHLSILLTLVEVPLMLMLWERFRRERTLVWLAGIALAYGIMLLAAFPQLVYYFSLFFMIYVLMQSAMECTSPAAARREAKSILLLGIFILMGVGIGAIQLLPSADFVTQSFRQNASYEFCASFSFPADHLMTFLVPRLFGYNTELGPSLYWGSGNYWEMSSYIGLLPIALVVPGLMAAPRRQAVALGACAVVFLVIALGDQTPLFRMLYRYLPFFNAFRGISKNIVVTELCLLALAAYGMNGLLAEIAAGEKRRLLHAATASAAVMLLGLAAMYVWYAPGAAKPGSHWQQMLHRGAGWVKDLKPHEVEQISAWSAREIMHAVVFCSTILALLVLGSRMKNPQTVLPLMALLTAADLGAVFVPMMRTYPEKLVEIPAPLIEPLQTAPYPARGLAPASHCNTPMLYGLCTASGYIANNLGRFNDFANVTLHLPLTNPQLTDPFPYISPKLKILAIEWMILPSGLVKGPLAGKVVAQAEQRSLVRVDDSCPRAWLASAPVSMSKNAALDYVQHPENDLLRSPAIEHPVEGISAAPLEAGEKAEFLRFSPNRVELKAIAKQPRVLVVSEMYERNWTATVNGKPAGIFPVNYILRGVIVPAGETRVIMEYKPGAFTYGICISAISTAIVAATLAGGWRKKIIL